MLDWFESARAWLQTLSWQEQMCLGLSLFLISFFGSLAFTALVIVQMPATYFQDTRHPPALVQEHPIIRWAGRIGKNLLGLVLIVLGVLLSLPGIPGQGLLTILIGLMLLDFPGKHRLERKLVLRPSIRSTIDRLRARFGKPPLVLDESEDSH
jgi:hypothetical protein